MAWSDAAREAARIARQAHAHERSALARGVSMYSGKRLAALATPRMRAAIAEGLRSWRSGTGTPYSPAMYGRRAAALVVVQETIRATRTTARSSEAKGHVQGGRPLLTLGQLQAKYG